ncbi:DEAD/DEAH box helicase family protein [Nonomuraea sp. NPDC003804]|uniref:DEAD/DEAH box helicase family protein n=1 Tax=Nonomuraea sp. NPDC003804 TaxID=3154547 RepID=UPI0033AA4AA7
MSRPAEHDFAAMRPPWELRRHQRDALDELERLLAAGRRRAWLVLPPGAGKTLVGLEAARRLGRPVAASVGISGTHVQMPCAQCRTSLTPMIARMTARP